MELDISTLLSEYSDANDKYNEYKNKKEELRNKIAEYMHDIKQNEISVFDTNDRQWSCVYQNRETKSVDHGELLRLVGPVHYSDVVKTKNSTIVIHSRTFTKSGRE
jgi:chromosome segregation ATPase